MGDHTVLFTTASHLMHVYGEKHPQVGVVLSFADYAERESDSDSADTPVQPVLVKALADRVVLASKKLGRETQFTSQPLFMLESILLGYLSTTSQSKMDVKAIQDCLRHLDTNLISQKLVQHLAGLGLDKSVNFIVKN